LHHAASRGKKDFLEKGQNGAIEGVQLSAVQKEQSFGQDTTKPACLSQTRHYCLSRVQLPSVKSVQTLL
jgi:hypothetical protein